MEDFAVLVEFALGILTVSGFQPIMMVATLTFGSRHALRLDARAVGVLAGAAALWLRAPTILVVALAAAVTVGARFIGLG